MSTPSDSKPRQANGEANSEPSPTLPLMTPRLRAGATAPTQAADAERAATATTAGTHGASHSPAMPAPDVANAARINALSTMEHVVELADSVVHIADQLHERILEEIACYQDRIMPDSQKAVMHTLMDDELLLRQHAQALYAEATTYVIHGLDQPQRHLMALTAAAAEQIRHIGVIAETTGLVGEILSLVGGIATCRLSQVEAALESIKLHHTALKALKPAPQVKS